MTIAPGHYARWLDGDATDAGEAMLLLRAPDDGEFVWQEVSTRVNRVANDDAQLMLPIWAEQTEAEAPKAAKRPQLAKLRLRPPVTTIRGLCFDAVLVE